MQQQSSEVNAAPAQGEQGEPSDAQPEEEEETSAGAAANALHDLVSTVKATVLGLSPTSPPACTTEQLMCLREAAEQFDAAVITSDGQRLLEEAFAVFHSHQKAHGHPPWSAVRSLYFGMNAVIRDHSKQHI